MQQTVDYIKSVIGDFNPEVCIVLGSGLGELADEYSQFAIPYEEIPNFISSTVVGHKGRLVFAQINGKKTVMMQGRVHFYEGHTMQEITYPIKVMKKLGVSHLILTNAAGGINPDFTPGDIMIITDHINNMCSNPLIGKNDDNFGTRFPDMTEVYKKDLVKIAKESSAELGFDIKEGVYLANSGPSYETPAEIKMYKLMGADAVGMSTVPEAIVGNYCGMKILGLSCITNSASKSDGKKLSHNEVIETSNKVKTKFKSLVVKILEKI